MLFILVTFLCNFAVIKLQYSQTDYTVVIKTIVLSVFFYGYHLHKITITALPFYEIMGSYYAEKWRVFSINIPYPVCLGKMCFIVLSLSYGNIEHVFVVHKTSTVKHTTQYRLKLKFWSHA